MKHVHEDWVRFTLSLDGSEQLRQEQWASLLDELAARLDWDNWEGRMSCFTTIDNRMYQDSEMELRDTAGWILTRVWPRGNGEIRLAIQAMGRVLNDLLNVWGWYARIDRADSNIISVYYPDLDDDSERSHRLLVRHEKYLSLLEQLAFELTRYGNYIADLVRLRFNPNYRFREGLLAISSGLCEDLMYYTYCPEFREDERRPGGPYTNLEEFQARLRASTFGLSLIGES
jgi:hypothetical protein